VARVIAVFNQSGGVGKTTLTMNLGHHLAALDQKVLLVDMDPQGSLTTFMGLDPFELETTVYQSIMMDESPPIHSEIHGMDLVPSNINLCGAEMELVTADMRDFRLKEALQRLQNEYNFILVDCPPSLGILSYISLVAATHILVPIQTHYKALMGTGLLFQTIQRVRSRANKNLKIAGFVPTLYDQRNSQCERSLASIRQQLQKAGTIFPPVPAAIAFADAAEKHKPLAVYSTTHKR